MSVANRVAPRPAFLALLAVFFLCGGGLVLLEGPSGTMFILFHLVGLCWFGALGVAVVSVLADRREHPARTLSEFALLLLTLVATFTMGQPLASWKFQRLLPQMETVVATIDAADLPPSGELLMLDAAPTSDFTVFARTSPDTGLSVEFLTRRAFPVKHAGYLFESTDALSSASRLRWPRAHRLQPHWFRFSD